MEMIKENNITEQATRDLMIGFLIILTLATIFEVGLLIFAWVNADKVECNLLWCSFTKVRSQTFINQECFVNGKEVNCSEIEHYDRKR